MSDPVLITTRAEALGFLEARIASGVKPGLERIEGVLELMGDPHRGIPVVHIAGTNGKTTTVGLVRDLLLAQGLRVGTFTSPHLHRLEERYTIDGRVVDERELVEAIADVAPFVTQYEEREGTTVTYFEVTTAAAFAAFQGAAVDVAVVEVGLGGRLDATNVVEADVSAITGVAIDHTSYLGSSIAEIAAEKAAIVKTGGVLVTGPLPAAAEGAVTAHCATTNATWLRFGEHFDVKLAEQAVGGWLVDVRGMHGGHEDLFLPLYGRHQVDHLATSVAVVEAFLGRALDPSTVSEAAAAASSPGRLEVVQRGPLVLIDGAHNEQGIGGLAETLSTEFPDARRILIVGFRGERSPRELLEMLAGMFEEVIVTEANDEHSISVGEVAAQARDAFGPDVSVDVVAPVSQAVVDALHRAGPEDMVVVTGSLYVAGEARRELR